MEPKVYKTLWHHGSQPTTSILGMMGVKYLQDPAAGDMAQPFHGRQGAPVISISQTTPVASVSIAISLGARGAMKSPQIPPEPPTSKVRLSLL